MIQDNQHQVEYSSRLELFIANDCPSCVNALYVADKAAAYFPELKVTITNLDMPNAVIPDMIFAVPTFCLDGRIVSLGTPNWRALKQKIRLSLTASQLIHQKPVSFAYHASPYY